jgi:hypothetical protein
MTYEEALEIVEQVLPAGTLTSVQVLVFRQAWLGKEYAAIAKESGYNYGYIRDTGSQLWRSLSHAFKQPVKKKNFRAFFQQRFNPSGASVKGEPAIATPTPALITPCPVWTPETPEFPGGPLPINSKFYIERANVETRACAEIAKPGSLLHLKAPRKMGKSSLLLRIADNAANLGYHTATLDFRQVDGELFANLDHFLRWFCVNISLQLGLEPKLDEYWNVNHGSKISCTLYFTQYLLKQLSAPLVLLLNEFDWVLEHPKLSQELLPLLLSWYEEAKRIESLKQLRMVLAYSTDSYIFSRLNQFPLNGFNYIGLPIELPELNLSQIQQLAQQYGLNWTSSKPAQQLMDLVGGHPYLVQLALYHLWSGDVTLEQLIKEAPTSAGIYNHYLQSCLAMLRSDPKLALALKHILHAHTSAQGDRRLIHKLENLGLVKIEGNQIKLRCKLYQSYFISQLPLFESSNCWVKCQT